MARRKDTPVIEAVLTLCSEHASTTLTTTLAKIPTVDDEIELLGQVWIVQRVQEPDWAFGETELHVWAEFGWPADLLE